MTPRTLVTLVLIGSLVGFCFAATSTYDFAAHLDRQVHNLHCSFIPGMSSGASAASQGCQVTLMSPYSSLLREYIWGGIPIALFAMAVFAGLAALAASMLLLNAERERIALATLLLMASIPVAASLVMGSIALFKLHTACKQCIGIYLASACVSVAAVLAQRDSPDATPRKSTRRPAPPSRAWLLAVPLTGALLIALTTSYVLAMPRYERVNHDCGTLTQQNDAHSVFVHLPAPSASAHKAIEIFDPLCPACKAFETRLATSNLDQQLQRDLLLFPLDKTCNWMLDSTLHPGSCAVSTAVLCAGDHAKSVMDWAFSVHEQLETAGRRDKDAPTRMVHAQFPELASCMTSAVTKARLTQGLRWAVKNRIPVLTPQLYVSGKRVCDEDTDLGLEFTLSRMLKGDTP